MTNSQTKAVDEQLDEILMELRGGYGTPYDTPSLAEAKQSLLQLLTSEKIKELEWCLKRPHGGQASFYEIKDRIKELKGELIK